MIRSSLKILYFETLLSTLLYEISLTKTLPYNKEKNQCYVIGYTYFVARDVFLSKSIIFSLINLQIYPITCYKIQLGSWSNSNLIVILASRIYDTLIFIKIITILYYSYTQIYTDKLFLFKLLGKL